LEAILTDIKNDVDANKSFEEAAKAKGLEVKVSNWFKRGGDVSELGHIAGLSSYAFFNPLRPKDNSKTSEVLQSPNWIAIFEKAGSLPAGSRDLDFAQPKIEESLKAKAKVNVIAEHLKANIDKIAASEPVEKVAVDSASVSYEGYLPGLGYANPELYKALSSAKEGEWSGPYTSIQNAVLLKILNKSVPDDEKLKALINDELSMAWQYGAFSAFGEYMRNLESSAKIVNNLDLYYRE